MDFIKFIKNELIQANNMDDKEIAVWSVLYISFKLEIMKTIPNTNIEKEIAMLFSEEDALLNLIGKEVGGKYPSSYVLMFRQYFLDKVCIYEHTWSIIHVFVILYIYCEDKRSAVI